MESLRYYLKNGIPSTYTIEEAYNFTNEIDEEPQTTTTPLHLIATHMPQDTTEAEMAVLNEMVTTLLEYGAGWCLTDVNNDTPGCILIKRNLKNTPIYEQIVDAGVRAELLLRKVTEFDMEVIEDYEGANEEETAEAGQQEEVEIQAEASESSARELEADVVDDKQDPSHNQDAYLRSKLQYTDDALVTEDGQDGVMMAWESNLMKIGCDSLFKGSNGDETNVLNIGFGMGIIDTMINERNPTKHYICEAHPDVLQKMKDDGWYNKPNVVVLDGRWQDQLDKLLSSGEVYFDGIYYDTFSEHYTDMLDLFDYVVGLLKPTGVFSFFNGLGADREVIYEVYKKLVEIDLGNYGLKCEFQEVKVPDLQNDDTWDGIRRPYWLCPVFYHPEARFLDI